MTIWAPILDETITTKYRAIAEAIANDIARGALTPGQRLPTQRALAKALNVTVGTIGRAYALAEKRGLISLEVGRGSYVRTPAELDTESNSRRVIDLGLNLPPRLDDADPLSRALLAAGRPNHVSSFFRAMPVESLERHRRVAAEWMARRFEACDAANTLICGGTQPALLASLSAIARPGDSVLVESLSFPGMIAAANFLGLHLVPVSMDEDGLDPRDLRRMSRRGMALYTIPTNHTPTAITMSLSRRREIAEIATDKELIVIEDDVYGQLIPNAPPPLISFIPQQGFLLCSLSKTISVGLRLAFLYTPPTYREAVLSRMRASTFFPAPLLVELACELIESGTADEFLRQRTEIARQRIELARQILGPDLISGDPLGNHIWIRLPDSWSAAALERAARENDLIVFSASAFSTDSARTPNAVRVSLGAAFNTAELQVGLTQLTRLLDDRPVGPIERY